MENSIVEEISKRKVALRASELAELLDVTSATIYGWVKDRKMPVMKVGSSIRFDPKQTADWVRERCA